MALRAACPSCRMPAEFPDHAGGQRVTCPVCKAPYLLAANAAMGRPQAAASGGGSGGLIVALVLGLGLLFFCGVGVVGAGIFYFRASSRLVVGAKPAPPPMPMPAPAVRVQPMIPIDGLTPAPSAPPAPFSPPAPAMASSTGPQTAELSNGRYNTINGKLVFAVDYNFPNGMPPSGTAVLAVTGGDGKRFELRLFRGREKQQGTLHGDALTFGTTPGPFMARIETGPPNAKAISPTIELTQDPALQPHDPIAEMRKQQEEAMAASRKRHEELMAESKERMRKAQEDADRRMQEMRDRTRRP